MVASSTDSIGNTPPAVAGMDPFDAVIQEKRESNRRQFERTVQDSKELNSLIFILGLFLGGKDNELLTNPDAVDGIADSISMDRNLFTEIISNFLSGSASASESVARVRSNINISQFDLDRAEKVVAQYANSGNPLLEVIAEKESGGDYNRIYGKGHQTAPLTSMTVNEVIEWQKGRSFSAAGKYQVIRDTLIASKNQMGLSGNELYDEKMQDRIALHLLNGRGYQDYKSGDLPERDFMLNISKEWAAAPKDETGRGYYDGDGVNQGLIAPATILVAMRHAKDLDTGSQTQLASSFVAAREATSPLQTDAQQPAPATAAFGNGEGVDQIARAAQVDTSVDAENDDLNLTKTAAPKV